MFKDYTKFVLLIPFILLITSCGATPVITPVEPIQSPTLPVIEEVPTSTSWKKVFGDSGDNTLQEVILSDEGDYFLVGSTNLNFDREMTGDVYLIKTDANGEILWEETYGGDGFLHGQTLYQTEDGLLISGVKSSADTQGDDIFVLQLDQDRNELWVHKTRSRLSRRHGSDPH